MNSDEKVQAVFILEVIGKPAEHLTETLNKIIGDIEKEKGIKIIEKKINEPTPLKKKEGFFSSFTEVEAEFESLDNLLVVLFKYFPAHIEITYPEKMNLSNSKITELLNEISRKLHGFDEVARVLQTEKSVLEKRLKEQMNKKE